MITMRDQVSRAIRVDLAPRVKVTQHTEYFQYPHSNPNASIHVDFVCVSQINFMMDKAFNAHILSVSDSLCAAIFASEFLRMLTDAFLLLLSSRFCLQEFHIVLDDVSIT